MEVNLLLVETGRIAKAQFFCNLDLAQCELYIKIGNFCNFQFFFAVFLFIYLVIILASKSKEGENIEKGF